MNGFFQPSQSRRTCKYSFFPTKLQEGSPCTYFQGGCMIDSWWVSPQNGLNSEEPYARRKHPMAHAGQYKTHMGRIGMYVLTGILSQFLVALKAFCFLIWVPTIYVSIHLSVCLPVWLPVCLSVHLPRCLPVCLSDWLLSYLWKDLFSFVFLNGLLC